MPQTVLRGQSDIWDSCLNFLPDFHICSILTIIYSPIFKTCLTYKLWVSIHSIGIWMKPILSVSAWTLSKHGICVLTWYHFQKKTGKVLDNIKIPIFYTFDFITQYCICTALMYCGSLTLVALIVITFKGLSLCVTFTDFVAALT